MNNQIIELDISDIIAKHRIREESGDLATLENSIRKLGVLHPIIVDKNMILICGGRRLEACRNTGRATIPAIKLDIEAGSMMAIDIQSDENFCRSPLTNEEFEKSIRMKKETLKTGKLSESDKGIMTRLKKLFS